MLIISLMKGVPARTTRVVTVGGVLKREEMDLVLNPHDAKSVEAADFVKGRVGGKTIILSMGPDFKLIPLMKGLYSAEVYGADEEVILSDRKMAGADTLATSYTVSMGVKKILDRHAAAIDELVKTIRSAGYSATTKDRVREFYFANLITNRVYSELPSVKESIMSRFLDGKADVVETAAALEDEKKRLMEFIIVSGIKTTDGETGSVGPQVAQSLSEIYGVDIPHVTYVDDFDIDTETLVVEAERKIGNLVQKIEINPPCVLTISPEYRARAPSPSTQEMVRLNNYRGKVAQAMKWTADDLGADPTRLGIAGSPTIVGPGVDIGKPPVQKLLDKSLIFASRVEKFQAQGKDYGPFEAGDLADSLPADKAQEFKQQGKIKEFSFEDLAKDVFL